MHSARSAFAILVVLMPIASHHADSRVARLAEGCTPTPALYQTWKSTTPWAQAPDSTVRRHVDSLRGSVTYDPFDSVIAGDGAARARERVLWEEDSVIVIVAKPPIPRDALILPKSEMMFPTDASEWLLNRLATVSVAASDAFIQTAGKQCDSSLAARIWINPPGAIGVRHLHVHVQPPAAIAIQDEQDFYARMSRHLADKLSIGLH